jgi:hypothetical protein
MPCLLLSKDNCWRHAGLAPLLSGLCIPHIAAICYPLEKKCVGARVCVEVRV